MAILNTLVSIGVAERDFIAQGFGVQNQQGDHVGEFALFLAQRYDFNDSFPKKDRCWQVEADADLSGGKNRIVPGVLLC